MGFDELAALYDSYRVFSVKYKITAQSTDNSDLRNTYVLVWQNDVITNPSTIAEGMEQPGCRYAVTNRENPCVISGTLTPNLVLGQTKRTYQSDPNTQALCNTSPNFVGYLHIMAGNGLSSFAVSYSVELEFDAEFKDPKRLNQS